MIRTERPFNIQQSFFVTNFCSCFSCCPFLPSGFRSYGQFATGQLRTATRIRPLSLRCCEAVCPGRPKFITCCLDYCNSLLPGVTDSLFRCLQSLQHNSTTAWAYSLCSDYPCSQLSGNYHPFYINLTSDLEASVTSNAMPDYFCYCMDNPLQIRRLKTEIIYDHFFDKSYGGLCSCGPR